jgi:uncharacterized protein YjbJ (UPF0337 family)
MDWQFIEGNWLRLRTALQQRWARLSDADLQRVAGKQDLLIAMIQEKYGIRREEAEREVVAWAAALEQAGLKDGDGKRGEKRRPKGSAPDLSHP